MKSTFTRLSGTLVISIASAIAGYWNDSTHRTESYSPAAPAMCDGCEPHLLVTAGNPCNVVFVPLAGSSTTTCFWDNLWADCIPSTTCYKAWGVVFKPGIGGSVTDNSGNCVNADALGEVPTTVRTRAGGPPNGTGSDPWSAAGCETMQSATFTLCTNNCAALAAGAPCAGKCETVIAGLCTTCKLGIVVPF